MPSCSRVAAVVGFVLAGAVWQVPQGAGQSVQEAAPSSNGAQSLPAPVLKRRGVEAAPGGAGATDGMGPVEVLSDTGGVNFSPYIHGILHTIYGAWVGLMPAEARSPELVKGETEVRFTINPDGELVAMHLDARAKDEGLNRAAWGAITAAQRFPPLPADFKGPNLQLRVHFVVNMQ